MARKKRAAPNMRRKAGQPARRWYAAVELERDAQGFVHPVAMVDAARELIQRLRARHDELREGHGGLWGARYTYLEERGKRADGSPIWDDPDNMKALNVKMASQETIVGRLSRAAKDAAKTLTGATRRRSIRGVAVYVYPDSSPKSRGKRTVKDASKDSPQQPGAKRDKFGRFWNPESGEAPKPPQPRGPGGKFTKRQQ